MSLLRDIVTTLSSKEGSLVEALLKTKVLLHKMGHQELVEWVNNELNGYAESATLPSYRIVHAQVLANVSNLAYRITAHPIPIGHLTPEQRERLETARLYQSLAVLEELTKGEAGSLQQGIPMEANGILGKGLTNGFHIELAWSEINRPEVTQVFVQVRSRLLDFILSLQDELGEDVADENIREQASNVDTPGLFQHAVFGGNTTIVVGDHNTQKTTNITVKGDFNVLAETLRSHGVAELDISDLKEAIEQDGPIVVTQSRGFGPRVKAWLQRMFSKAIDASWQIEIGIAGSLLATALQHYYGLP